MAAQERTRETEVFRPVYDVICGAGTALSAGCDAIRAREIVDASADPWRAIGRVNFADRRVRQHCTGALVAPDVVLTAAHCLFNFADNRWVVPTNVTFVAAFQRGDYAGVAQVVRYHLDPQIDRAARVYAMHPSMDWALLELAEPLGEQLGYFPLQQDAGDAAPILPGYAGLRPNVLSVAECSAAASLRDGTVLTQCAAMRGDSGAPLLVPHGDGFAVVGIFSSLVERDCAIYGLGVASSQVEVALGGLLGLEQ